MTKVSALVLAASAPIVVLAFWPMYLSRPFAATDPYTHVHALVGTLWFLLLIAQPLAIRTRRPAIHRTLGRVSYVLAPLFALAAVLLSHHRLTSMSDATFAVEGYSHYLPFYATVSFATAYVLGLRHRRVPAAHGRLMLATAVPLVDPVVSRVLAFYFPPLPNPWLYQVVTFGLATAIAAWLAFSYRGSGPPRRALIGYLVVLVALEAGWFTVSQTRPGLDAVGWFRSLPLT